MGFWSNEKQNKFNKTVVLISNSCVCVMDFIMIWVSKRHSPRGVSTVIEWRFHHGVCTLFHNKPDRGNLKHKNPVEQPREMSFTIEDNSTPYSYFKLHCPSAHTVHLLTVDPKTPPEPILVFITVF